MSVSAEKITWKSSSDFFKSQQKPEVLSPSSSYLSPCNWCVSWPEKNSQHNQYYLFATVVMDFKMYVYTGRLVKMPKIRVVNQQYHKDFFFKMWIKARFIEMLAKDLENQWIADGKKKSVFLRAWNDVVWCNPSEAGGEYLVELKGFLIQWWTQQKQLFSSMSASLLYVHKLHQHADR